MLGYFRPTTSQISEDEKKLYKSIYCKLCKTIGKRYGKIDTLFIQHDLVFILLIIIENINFNEINFEKKSCTICSLKRIHIINDEKLDDILNILADICVFTVYTAYINRMIDKKGNSIKNKLFYYIYGKTFEKCIINLNINKKEIEKLKEIIYKETHNNSNYVRTPDAIIHPMCEYYSDLIVYKLNMKVDLKVIPYNMCKIMYYIDALDDLNKDREDNKFNILNEIYESEHQVISLVEKKVLDAISEINNSIVNNLHKNIIENVLNISILNKVKNIKIKYKNNLY